MRRPAIFAGERIGLIVRLVVNGLVQVATVLAAGMLAARLLSPSAEISLTTAVAQLAVCALMLFVLRWLERVDATRLAQSYVLELRGRLFARLWHSHARDTLRRGRGALLLRLTGDMGAIGRWVGQGLARIVVTAVMVVGVCGALLWVEPWLAAVALVLVGALGCAALAARDSLDVAVRKTRIARGRLATDATDRLQALAAIQVSGAWRAEQARLERRSRAVRDTTITESQWSASLLAGSEMIGLLAPTLALVTVVLLSGASASLAHVPIVVALFGLLVTPLRDSMRVFDYWRKARIAQEKVEEMLSLPRLPRPRVSPPLAVERIDEILVEGLTIAEGAPPLDLFAERGARVLLSGEAGTGKSQLLRMLVRLADPVSGHVNVNGRDLRDVDLASLRARIALVSLSLGLQRGSLKRVVALRRPQASRAQIATALQRCRLEEVVARLPQGMDTRLEEGWPELSTMERMRLLLAQAFLAECDVLLLDDVDSTVAPSHVHELRAMLADFRGIVVLVSNQPRWLSWASALWSLDEAALLAPPVPVIHPPVRNTSEDSHGHA
jgi:ABC-type multidrug transport system fused ATPase/permease subunit